VCGRICFHPCEDCCNVNHLGKGPVAIRALKRFVAEMPGAHFEKETKAEETGSSVAIIGSGPAGLTTAYYLARLGHAVTVFEKLPEAGGMMRYGIPENKLPRDVLGKDIDTILDTGVRIELNSEINSLDELFNEKYNAIFVAIGAYKTEIADAHVNNERIRVKRSGNSISEMSGKGSSGQNHDSNLNLDADNGNLVTIDDNMSTKREGVFAGGEATSGKFSVIEAVADGRAAAISIDRYLGGSGEIDVTFYHQEDGVVQSELQGFPVEERIEDSIEEMGLNDEQAVSEAKRCLRCDLPITIDANNCVGCLICVMRCSLRFDKAFSPAAARVKIIPFSDGRFNEISFTDECDTCGICARYCPHNAIYRGKMKAAEVR
jgi:Pyruvate/2-oxoacid:ferredoxin oxidoreductase delta subunit